MAPPAKKDKPKSTFDLSRLRSSDRLETLHPDVLCRKCGSKCWNRERPPLTWACLKCGNLVYIELGQPVQQIDVLMKSVRKHEYRKTGRGTVIPVPGLEPV